MVWTCTACTFENRKDDARKCVLCESQHEGGGIALSLSSDVSSRAPNAAAPKRKMAQRDLFGNVIATTTTNATADDDAMTKKRKTKQEEKSFRLQPPAVTKESTTTKVHSSSTHPFNRLESSRTVVTNASFDELRKKAKQVMRDVFGIAKLRKLQPVAIECALRRQSQIVVMATGGGKSLCYQLPATVLGGITLVISPLIALMMDQVKSLHDKGIAAALLCSANTERENNAVMERLLGRSLKQQRGKQQPVIVNSCDTQQAPTLESITLLYCTPELIKTDRFRGVLTELHRQNRLALFAVDEAHLVSTWGHDFRPSYRQLSWLREAFPMVPCMACTATATAKVIQDIRQTLQLEEKDAPCHVGSFDRPNIFYKVAFKDTLDATNPRGAMGDMLDFIKKQHSRATSKQVDIGDSPPLCSGIVYCHTRNDTTLLARQITSVTGVRAAAYHAGLKDAERNQVQQQWMSGQVQVAVATVALGMGIDLPHIRYVIHWSLAKSLEGFYQESGRAGRDGLPSHSVLYYSQSDASLFSFLIQKQKNPTRALDALQRMVDYCITGGCRRQYILRHFGEEIDPTLRCQQTCDYCRDPKKIQRAIETAKVIKDVKHQKNNNKNNNHRRKSGEDGQWDRPHGDNDDNEQDGRDSYDWDVGELGVTSARTTDAALDTDDQASSMKKMPLAQGFVKASTILSKFEKLEERDEAKERVRDKANMPFASSSDKVSIPDHIRAQLPDPLKQFSSSVATSSNAAARLETSSDLANKTDALQAELTRLKAEQAKRLEMLKAKSAASSKGTSASASLPPPPPPPSLTVRSAKKQYRC